MVEVRRLPGVQQYRPLGARAGRVAPRPRMQPGGDGVQAVGAVAPHQPGAGVGLARLEHDLAGGEQLTTTEDALALGRALGVRRVVAAPGQVGRPDLPVAEAEAGHARGHEQVGVVPGASVPRLAQVGPEQPRTALRCPLAAPPAGQVEQLGGARTDRDGVANGAQVEPPGPGVGDRRAQSQDALAGQLELDVDGPAGLGVLPGELHDRIGRRVAVVVVGDVPVAHVGLGGGGVAAVAEAREGRGPGEAGGSLGEQPAATRPVERGVRDRGHGGGGQPGECGGQLLTQRCAPVEEVGHPGRRGREHDAHALSRQVDRVPWARGQPFTAPDVSPRTKKRCSPKNTAMGSTIETKAPAVSSS